VSSYLLLLARTILTYDQPSSFGTGQQKAVGSGPSAYQANNNSMDTRDEYSHLPALHQQILRFLISQDSKDGVHVAAIARSVGKTDSDAQKLRSVKYSCYVSDAELDPVMI
jgi:hypothetical protein